MDTACRLGSARWVVRAAEGQSSSDVKHSFCNVPSKSTTRIIKQCITTSTSKKEIDAHEYFTCVSNPFEIQTHYRLDKQVTRPHTHTVETNDTRTSFLVARLFSMPPVWLPFDIGSTRESCPTNVCGGLPGNGQHPKLPQLVGKRRQWTESRNACLLVVPRDVHCCCRAHRTSACNGDSMHPLKVQIAMLVRKFMVEPNNPIFHLDPKKTKFNSLIKYCWSGDTVIVMTFATISC